MLDPEGIQEISIFKEQFPTDMRFVSYKGVYNRLSQGSINDIMGGNHDAFGQKNEDMFDHEYRAK